MVSPPPAPVPRLGEDSVKKPSLSAPPPSQERSNTTPCHARTVSTVWMRTPAWVAMGFPLPHITSVALAVQVLPVAWASGAPQAEPEPQSGTSLGGWGGTGGA